MPTITTGEDVLAAAKKAFNGALTNFLNQAPEDSHEWAKQNPEKFLGYFHAARERHAKRLQDLREHHFDDLAETLEPLEDAARRRDFPSVLEEAANILRVVDDADSDFEGLDSRDWVSGAILSNYLVLAGDKLWVAFFNAMRPRR